VRPTTACRSRSAWSWWSSCQGVRLRVAGPAAVGSRRGQETLAEQGELTKIPEFSEWVKPFPSTLVWAKLSVVASGILGATHWVFCFSFSYRHPYQTPATTNPINTTIKAIITIFIYQHRRNLFNLCNPIHFLKGNLNIVIMVPHPGHNFLLSEVQLSNFLEG